VNTLSLNSYAKLNLYLEVLKKRKDNYHNLKTLFARIDLADKIIIKSRQDKKISIACNLPDVSGDNANLAYRSAKILQEACNIDRGADIRIIKRIPVAAGLGGGSSNAATVLLGLNKLWKLDLSKSRLANFARRIGCDVPFFIYDIPFAKGSSRGDKIEPLESLKETKLWHILVVPEIKVSTPLIYKKWDTYSAFDPAFPVHKKQGAVEKAGLTRPKYSVNILISALRKKDLSLAGAVLFNSLERITTKLYPQISRIKRRLMRLGVKSILMSGSGPAIFGIVSSRKEALSLCKQLKEENNFLRVFVTRTI
jgi:4-diphosphocytidyl-2-C-methyl-D-erythritol kinase